MKIDKFMTKLDDQLALHELQVFAQAFLSDKTGIQEWDIKFFLGKNEAPQTMTLGEWRPDGTMTASPKKDGGIKVMELA